MAFKIKKLHIDLTLDLTEYIPGDAGLIDSDKKSPTQVFDWTRFTAQSADKLGIELKREGLSNDDTIMISRDALISQIDWFYDKGKEFWYCVPFSCLRDILEYVQGQVVPAQKK